MSKKRDTYYEVRTGEPEGEWYAIEAEEFEQGIRRYNQWSKASAINYAKKLTSYHGNIFVVAIKVEKVFEMYK